MFETVWEGRPTVDHVLANAVNKLRKALGEEGARRLVNVPRIGYRLAGPIERVAVGRQGVPAVALKAGDPVPGREGYKLRQPLGDTSNSAVWLAFDAKLKASRVFKFAIDGERLASLKREYTVYRVLRQELGERADFARVLGANFSNAPYFLECEYGGVDLPAWAAEHAQLAGMTLAERLALFLQIAHAVAAAHAVGVLHKDLKPSNVLIATDANGWVARLTDFGSSRLLEPGRLAELGVTAMGMTLTQGTPEGLLGSTPLYLAPELLAGHSPTTGSDLYALGLMLYQLLVGDFRRPMSTGWERDIADPLLRQDLTAATEGRPDQRLGSVAEFAERLVRLEQRRADETQRAQAAELAGELAQQLQKNRAQRPWIVAVLASLALGLAASLWFYSQASAALRRAQQESTRAQAINDFLNKDVLQPPDAIRSGNVKVVSALDIIRRASANAAERFKGEPLTEAAVRFRLGQILMRMGASNDAEPELRASIALLSPRVRPDDPVLLGSRFALAQALIRMRDHWDEATRLIDTAERDSGAAALAARSEMAFQALQARTEWLMEAERNQAAVPGALRMVELADTVPGFDLPMRFEARVILAELYARLGENDKAKLVSDALEAPPFSADKVGDVLFARAKMNAAGLHVMRGEFDAAEAVFTSLRDRLTASLGSENLLVARVNFELGGFYEGRGHIAKAAQSLRDALPGFRAAYGDESRQVRVTSVNLAGEELALGHAGTALQLLDAIEPWFAAHEPNQSSRLWIRGRALNDLGRFAEALPVFEALNAEDMVRTTRTHWAGWRWHIQAERGRALVGVGRREEGTALMRPAVDALAEMKEFDADQLRGYRQLLPARPGTPAAL